MEVKLYKMLSEDISKINLPPISDKVYQKCRQKRMVQILAILLTEKVLKYY